MGQFQARYPLEDIQGVCSANLDECCGLLESTQLRPSGIPVGGVSEGPGL